MNLKKWTTQYISEIKMHDTSLNTSFDDSDDSDLNETAIFSINSFMNGIIPAKYLNTNTAESKAELKRIKHDLTTVLNTYWKRNNIPYQVRESTHEDVPQIDEAIEFTNQQLSQLKDSYKDIKTMNPTSPVYKKLINFLNSLDSKALKQISNADIKWLSMLAKNRIK